MKKLDELKFLLTSVFVINQTNEHKDNDISLILDYAFRRLYGANTTSFCSPARERRKNRSCPKCKNCSTIPNIKTIWRKTNETL